MNDQKTVITYDGDVFMQIKSHLWTYILSNAFIEYIILPGNSSFVTCNKTNHHVSFVFLYMLSSGLVDRGLRL